MYLSALTSTLNFQSKLTHKQKKQSCLVQSTYAFLSYVGL